MKITIIQPDIQWEGKSANLNHLANMISGIEDQTDLIVMPEMFNTGFSMNASELAETMGSETTRWMLDIAKKRNTAICGSYIVKEDGSFFNRFLFVDKTGREVSYNKRHLFSIGGEDILFTRGSERTLFNYCGLRINPAICYDLRFPVWLRNRGNYDLIICVANWPDSRRDVWNTLLKARAIENQSFVAAVNRVGNDIEGNRYAGESVILGPRGNVMAKLPEYQEGVITAEISLTELESFRKKFPVWKDSDDFTII